MSTIFTELQNLPNYSSGYTPLGVADDGSQMLLQYSALYGHFLYSRLYMYDARQQSLRALEDDNPQSYFVRYQPYGSSNDLKKILVTDYFDRHLYLMDSATGQKSQVDIDSTGQSLDGWNLSDARLSADGRTAFFNAYQLVDNTSINRFYSKDLQSGTLQKLADEYMSINSISADGRTLLLSNYPDQIPHLYLLDRQTGQQQELTFSVNGSAVNRLSYYMMVLSPDGQKLALVDAAGNLLLKNLQDGSLQSLVSKVVPDGLSTYATLRWSADQHYLDFTASALPQAGDGDGSYDIWRLDLQQHSLQMLTPHSGQQDNGYWNFVTSPNGRYMATIPESGHGPLFGLNAQQYSGVHTTWFADLQQGSAGSGHDVLNGSSGADTLAGLAGDDEYRVDNPGDQVLESANNGTDTVYSLLDSYTLPENVENLILSWSATAQQSTTGIQNGSGNAGNNLLQGNVLNNVLLGMDGNDTLIAGGGNDTLDGGAGFDQATLNIDSLTARISHAGNLLYIADNNGNHRCQLSNIERITFLRSNLSFEGDTVAAESYRLYQAAFNRAPDTYGLGYWIHQRDLGATADQIANAFIQSDEFKTLYGNQPTHTALATSFYQNVLHRAPDAAGLQYWVDLLDHNQPLSQILVGFSESTENQAALTGVLQAGFWHDRMYS